MSASRSQWTRSRHERASRTAGGETRGGSATAVGSTAPVLAALSMRARLRMLPPAREMRLGTTTRVLDQGLRSESCTSFAVATAIETRLVHSGAATADEQLVDGTALFVATGRERSVFSACDVAAKGILTPRGVKKTTARFMRAPSPEAIVDALDDGRPVITEAYVGSHFRTHDGAGLYRYRGSRLSHAMCILGHGTSADTAEPYWLAKNSYGPDWGDHGYVRLRWKDREVKPELAIHVVEEVV